MKELPAAEPGRPPPPRRRSPLPLFHAAVETGSLAVVRAVLAHRPAPVLWDDFGGKTVLERALLRGNPELILTLLEARPPPPRPVPDATRHGEAWQHVWPALRQSGLAALLACLEVVPALPMDGLVLPERLLGILAAWPHPVSPAIRAALVHEAMETSVLPGATRSSIFRRL